jgi:hypothetical protein
MGGSGTLFEERGQAMERAMVEGSVLAVGDDHPHYHLFGERKARQEK